MERDLRVGRDEKRSRFITGAVLLAGLLLLGLGIGLAAGRPAVGLIIGVGSWLAAVAVIRTGRGQ